ncbi:MAG: iron ABC transporter permease [Gammaproteobacteria bacterium]|nr:iron ABC transporter permease [Gammaproteobacteria bacterium]
MEVTTLKSSRFNGAGPWWATTFGVAAIAVFPILAIFWFAFFPAENIWPHLIATSLPAYLSNTLGLMAGVGVLVFGIGVSTAYVVTNYHFPLRKYFEWLLLLPLAVPAYVIAYLYTDILEFSGPVQSALRELFGWELARDYWFPNIRSLGGAVTMMGLVLYPYVYLLARASFLEQSPYLLDVSRLMGHSRWKTFFFVSLPIARPGIAIGIALALMETLNDFGTVDFFAVHTLTAGLFDVWLNMNNLGGAAQLAVIMLTFVLLLLGLEYMGRKRTGFYQHNGRFSRRERTELKGTGRWAAFFICFLPVLAGFLVPVVLLSKYAISYFDQSWTAQFRQYAFNSLYVSSVAAAGCALLALVISYAKRVKNSLWIHHAGRLASMGYAVPGAVLAVGVAVPLAVFDNLVDALVLNHFGISTGLILSGTTFALVLTYIIRFLAVSIGSVDASFSKVSASIDMAARTLGHSPSKVLASYHLPLVKSGLYTALLIVFVDCMKELPATLLLRPFNFETLATHVYLFASDELIEQSALGALLIVLVGLVPVVVLSQTIAHSQSVPPRAD